MSYIGNSPGVASQRVTTTITATAGQTQFTTLSGYILGYVDVYLNGAKLINGVDFEAITATYITLFTGAVVNDVVELVSYIPRGLTDGYTKAEADAKFLDVTGDTATGTVTIPTLNLTNALGIQYGGTGKTSAPAAMANLIGFTTTETDFFVNTSYLTNTSSHYQLFTGQYSQTVILPVTSTLQTGWTFHICNNTIDFIYVNSSGGNLVILIPVGTTAMCTCIGTTLTTAANWEAGYTDFSTITGNGAVVLASAPSIVSPSITSPSVTGTLSFSGSAALAANFHTTQTTGVMTIGGTAGTGNIIFGRSTASQQTDIQAGATASGSTKTINIGTAGLSGSTTAIAIGSAVSGATNTIGVNGTIGWTGPNIILNGTSTAASAIIRVQGSTGDQWQFGAGIVNAGDWGVTNVTRAFNPFVIEGGTTTPYFVWNHSGSEKMRLDSSGNLGIGTSTPVAKLQVELVGTASLASATIVKSTDFASTARAGFPGLTNNSDGIFFGMGANGTGIPAGFGFFREASGWNTALTFYTNNITSGPNNTAAMQEKMRLDSSGNLLVGTKSAPVGGANSAWANPGSTVFSMGPNGGNAFVLYNPSNVGCYVVGGQTGWTGTSDGTLKNVIAKIDNGLSSINGLNPIVYSWKSDETNTPYAGLIAQEVQSVLPDLVNDNNGTLGVNYTGVIPYLISAIQEQQALITQLQADVAALKGA